MKLLGGAALAPVVGKASLNERTLEDVCEDLRGDGIALNCISHPYKPGAFINVRSDPRDQIKSILYDGVKRVFAVEYEKAPPLFSDDGVTWTMPLCDCTDGPHGTACSNRNVLRRERLG